MATTSTIILKNGTSSAVPSSLIHGEPAINVTTGLLYYGSGSGNVVKPFSNFTHITASGDISSSAYITAAHITTSGDLNVGGKGTFSDDVFLADTKRLHGVRLIISASNSLDLMANTVSGVHVNDTYLKVDDYITATHISASGNITASGFIETESHITASGNISSSGTLLGGGLNINGVTSFNEGNITNVGLIDVDQVRADADANVFIKFDGSGLEFNVNSSDIFTFNSSFEAVDLIYQDSNEDTIFMIDESTTSVGVGALGQDPVATLHVAGNTKINTHLTASGNISSSGDVTARINNNTGFMLGSLNALSGDANNVLYLGNNNTWGQIIYGRENSDLHTFNGHITASGNISSSGGNIIAQREFPSPSDTAGNCTGDIVYFGGEAETIAAGQLVHYNSLHLWELADADTNVKSDGLLGIALGADADVDGVLLRGTVTLDHDAGSIGDVLYVSTTAGDATNTAPSSNNNIVRIIGYKISHNTQKQIWFNPDSTFVQVNA